LFSDDLKLALTQARNEALRLRHESVGAAHHALGVLQYPSPNVSSALAGFDMRAIAADIEQRLGAGTASLAIHDIAYADDARDSVGVAVAEARELGHDAVGADHLLLGVLQVPWSVPHLVFEEHGVTPETVRARIRALRTGAA
jgi:ATP-dependent Clp protease ATP-binding subunit ClpC